VQAASAKLRAILQQLRSTGADADTAIREVLDRSDKRIQQQQRQLQSRLGSKRPLQSQQQTEGQQQQQQEQQQEFLLQEGKEEGGRQNAAQVAGEKEEEEEEEEEQGEGSVKVFLDFLPLPSARSAVEDLVEKTGSLRSPPSSLPLLLKHTETQTQTQTQGKARPSTRAERPFFATKAQLQALRERAVAGGGTSASGSRGDQR
jgi:hypothetical protein